MESIEKVIEDTVLFNVTLKNKVVDKKDEVESDIIIQNEVLDIINVNFEAD